jgi:flagellar biosynthesis protein FlhF
MLTDDLEIRSHLLLSAATSEKEMEKTVINFKPLNCHNYIFTKLDETESCGSIVNQIMRTNLPISYITTGQNVPEDIERARRESIIKLVLNKTQTISSGVHRNGPGKQFAENREI